MCVSNISQRINIIFSFASLIRAKRTKTKATANKINYPHTQCCGMCVRTTSAATAINVFVKFAGSCNKQVSIKNLNLLRGKCGRGTASTAAVASCNCT